MEEAMTVNEFVSSKVDQNTDSYACDQHRREILGSLVQEVIGAMQRLDVTEDRIKSVKQLKETVLRDAFKVLVLGEFKTGKSTFINALLGKQILPSYVTPTTAIINEIKWREEAGAVLHFHGKDKEPLKIPVAEIENYVVIKDSEQEIADSPYSHVELFWPLELCRNHVEIIDSPGLNESDVREKVTMDYLGKVDAVLFVMTALRMGPSINEQKTLKTLGLRGHKETFLIVNQFDLLKSQRDRDAVIKRARGQIAEKYTDRPEERLHFVSSLDALEGRLQKNSVRLDRSQMIALEEQLHDFLGNERSRIKAGRAARDLQIILNNLPQVIREKRDLLHTPLEELKERYENARENFHRLQTNKSEIIRRVDGFRRDLRILVTGKVKDFFVDVESEVDDWIAEYKIDISLNFNVKAQIEQNVRQISESLNEKLDEAFREWTENILIVFVEERFDGLRRDLERLTEVFEADLRQTRFELRGADLEAEDLAVIREGPSGALERTLAAAGGFFIGGFAGAGLGAIFGWREVAKAILPQITAGLLASTLGLPVLPVLIAAAILQGGIQAGSIVKKLKLEVAKQYKLRIREMGPNQGEKIFDQLDEGLGAMATQLEQGLQVQMDEVRGQVDATLQEKEEGQQSVDEKLADMEQVERRLDDVEVQLSEFLISIYAQ
jgi:predicted GTPase/predicted nuclease with TOPRIM domain